MRAARTCVSSWIIENEWLTIPAGESKKRALPPGTYRLTVQAEQGNQALDAHDIEARFG